jgi:hypothetical protein
LISSHIFHCALPLPKAGVKQRGIDTSQAKADSQHGDDGDPPIDNNRVENAIRALVVGGKIAIQ